jgi:murein tripeptide amidase MpaA
MVNVDGVVYGNSRCDISGSDINRKWTKFPNKFIYPIISEVRNIFLSVAQQ